MNNYWSYQRTSPNYRRDLHKRLVATYNRRAFFDGSRNSDSIAHTDYVEDPLSPIIQLKAATFNIEEDGLKHHTRRYDLMQDDWPVPVLRRGQPFSLTLRFNRPYVPKEDFFHLVAEYGPMPSVQSSTKYTIPLSDEEPKKNDKWEMWSNPSAGSELKIQIQIPVKCQVGLWKFSIFSYKNNTPGSSVFNVPEDIYILFNPWNKDDGVYLEDEKERDEYVMNDHGKLWMGTNKAPTGIPWVFGQFDVVVLPVLALLMEQMDVPHSKKGSAVLIARALSAVINSFDDDGLLEGKWTCDFEDGTKPLSWTGSVGFYEEFLQSGRPVKYAQCWVFSGALTTACRALGIPCRPVTCYVCAHDSNNSLTVNKFFSSSGKLIEGGVDGDCYDSIWNFHCWNDVWMTRPDLPVGYDGWQAIDATPQEESNRKYRAGPASLKAIKEGTVGFQYDTGFVFAEVNADLCHFQEDCTSPWGFTRIKLDPTLIGKRVVTQSLVDNFYGERGMEDITSQYKSSEGTEAERASVFNALNSCPKAQNYYKAVSCPILRDVFFKLHEIGSVFVGDSFSTSLTIENHASEPRSVRANLTASAVIYTGKLTETVKESHVDIILRAKEAKTVKINVTPEEYCKKVSNNSQLKITAVASVLETKQMFSAEDDLELVKRRLDIEVPDDIKVGSVSEVKFSFTNPFVQLLTNCELTIEGPGLQRPKVLKLSNVSPNGHIKHSESLIPKRQGQHVLVATFNSDQLGGVKGFKNIKVDP